MRIGELAKLSDLPTSTIRYYEQKGLLPKAHRSASGYRVYEKTALDRLQIIKFAQSLGFSLDELPKMFIGTNGIDHDEVMSRLQDKLTEVDQLITQLSIKRERMSQLIGNLRKTWVKGECLTRQELAHIIADANI